MTRQVALTSTAKADLVGIWRYTVSEWSEAKAEQYLKGLRETFTLLALHPEIARIRQEITPAVRLHLHRSHLVIFVETDDFLNVLRVVHSRSDWRLHWVDLISG